MPHSTEPSCPEDLKSASTHLPETTSSYAGPVDLISRTKSGLKYETRVITPSNNDMNGPSTVHPPSKFLVKLRHAQEDDEESSVLLGVKSEFIPSCEGETAPITHKAKMDDFVQGLVLLNQANTCDGLSENIPSVASYIKDAEKWHPWVEVSESAEEKEPGTVQMNLTIRDPSTMETGSAEAEVRLSVQEEGL